MKYINLFEEFNFNGVNEDKKKPTCSTCGGTLPKHKTLCPEDPKNWDATQYRSDQIGEADMSHAADSIYNLLHLYDNVDSSTKSKIEQFFASIHVNNGQDTDKVIADVEAKGISGDTIDAFIATLNVNEF